MKILVAIDRQEAIRHGIDAPNSTGHVEVNPAALTERHRKALAELCPDGHDATDQIALLEPTLDELVKCLEYKAERSDRERDAQNELRDQWNKELIEAATHPEVVEEDIGLTKEGDLTKRSWEAVVAMPVQYTKVRTVPVRHGCSEEAKNVYLRAVAEREANRERAIEAALPALRRRLAEVNAKREAEKIAEETAYQELHSRLPEVFRRREAAGFATGSQVLEALRQLMREDAGLVDARTDWDEQEEVSILTDAQFEAFEEIQRTAPEGAHVTAEHVWDIDESDANVNEQIVAMVRWERGGVIAQVAVPLDMTQ